MGLLHASRVQGKVTYNFIHYSHRDIELDYVSDIDEFGLKNRPESLKILVNSRKWIGFSFLMFSIFYVLKNAHCTIQWRHRADV